MGLTPAVPKVLGEFGRLAESVADPVGLTQRQERVTEGVRSKSTEDPIPASM